MTGQHGDRIQVGRPSDRGFPPGIDHERAVALYRENPLSRVPDTFVLYRIIGNDLPPRHTPGQSRENLAFILQNEPDFQGCEKRFVVNRIVDPREEAAILRMLEEAGVRYLHIPFDQQAYRSLPWDLEGVPLKYQPWARGFSQLSEARQGRVLMRLYRHKNNYVMNNNGARNAALEEGRRVAKWVLPWDGNCFITASAWQEIIVAVQEAPEWLYFIVPMSRCTDNSLLHDDDHRPEANEEPQVLFRRDASLAFDPDIPYGRRPKIELLWRLGVPGKWDDWPIEPWDSSCPPYAEQAGAYGRAGWVARLFSGQEHLESGNDGGVLVDRGLARVEAIRGLLDRLDDELIGSISGRERSCMLPERLPKLPGELSTKLRAAADDAMTRGPYSVIDKLTLPPSGNRHDYWHPAPYYWPNPLRLPGLPYVRRDGMRVPGTQLYESLSENYDRTRLQRLFDDTFVLTLAWQHHDDRKYAEHAASLVRVWFLAPETMMNPHLDFAQVRWGHDGNKGSSSGIIEMKDLYYFLDAVRLLKARGLLTTTEQGGLDDWMDRYLHWLRTSPQGRKERTSTNNHGTYYDLQVAAIAAFLGESRLLRETLRDSRSRIMQQFDESGAQPEELSRTTTAHYCCFNLQGWIHLARLAESRGEDFWSELKQAMEWLLRHQGAEWPYQQIDEFDRERIYPVYHAYVEHFGSPCWIEPGSIPDLYAIKPIFYPHDGIMPYWQASISRLIAVVADTA